MMSSTDITAVSDGLYNVRHSSTPFSCVYPGMSGLFLSYVGTSSENLSGLPTAPSQPMTP